MESEKEAIGRIADILKAFEEEFINFAAASGYGTAQGNYPPNRDTIRNFVNSTNSKIQAIMIELRKITRDEDLIKRIMGN